MNPRCPKGLEKKRERESGEMGEGCQCQVSQGSRPPSTGCGRQMGKERPLSPRASNRSAVECAVRKYLFLPAGEREIELRLGTMDVSGRFSPGVSSELFSHMEAEFDIESFDRRDDHFEEIIDVFHGPLDACVRTRVSNNVADMRFDTEHVRKSSVWKCEFRHVDEVAEACRLEVSSERTAAPVTAHCSHVRHVRIKERQRFVDVRDGTDTWVYDLCKTWSGPTMQHAQASRSSDPPAYEVECEFVAPTCGPTCSRIPYFSDYAPCWAASAFERRVRVRRQCERSCVEETEPRGWTDPCTGFVRS